MQLVERYLQAVKFWLPNRQQDDIIAELSEDLRAQMDEREAELGRPLNEPEIEDLLRQRGSPLRVANGYLPQRSLIGPNVFPIYVFILKIVTVASLAWWCIAPIVGHAMGHIAGSDWVHVLVGTIRPFWAGWLFSAAITTLVFAAFERTPISAWIFEQWDPRKLPPVRSSNAIARSSSVAGVLGLLSLLLWWVVEMAPPLSIRLWSSRIDMAPGWSFVFWAVLILSLGSLTLEVTNLLRPWWTISRAAARLVLHVGGAVVFCWFLQAHLVAGLSWLGATPEKAADAVVQVNLWLAHMLPWAIVVELVIVAVDVWRLVKTWIGPARSSWNPARNPL